MRTVSVELLNIITKEIKTNVEEAQSIARVLSKKTRELLIGKDRKEVE